MYKEIFNQRFLENSNSHMNEGLTLLIAIYRKIDNSTKTHNTMLENLARNKIKLRKSTRWGNLRHPNVRFQLFSNSASLVRERLKSYPRVSEISLSCTPRCQILYFFLGCHSHILLHSPGSQVSSTWIFFQCYLIRLSLS